MRPASGCSTGMWPTTASSSTSAQRHCAAWATAEGATLKRAELRALLHPDDQAFVRHGLDRAAAEGGLFKDRYRVVLPDGELRHIEAIGRMRDAQSQERARMVGILRDVSTEIAQAQLTLEKEAAERATQLRIEFLSRLSHELRTPLNAVLGVAQLLAIDPAEPLSGNQGKRVQILLDSGEQLLRLVENVLDISRVDSGSLELRWSRPTSSPSRARASTSSSRSAPRSASASKTACRAAPRSSRPIRSGCSRCSSTCSATAASTTRAAGGSRSATARTIATSG